MRVVRWLERSAWLLGLGLALYYVSERLSFERAREAGVAVHRKSEVPAEKYAGSSPGTESAVAMPDLALWSRQRASEYVGSAVRTSPPAAVLTIPALQLEVPVYPGTSETHLSIGAGHIEGTAALASGGNAGVAAHRDGFFRKLKDIAIDDDVLVEVGDRTLRYRVADLRIVSPADTYVLAPTAVPTLTLVTCYPFYFLGAAPERFVVRAELASATESTSESI